MPQNFTINIDGPPANVALVDAELNELQGQKIDPLNAERAELKEKKAIYENSSAALQQVLEKINNYSEKVFSSNSEQIAKLAVAIADKILKRRVEDSDYDIQAIVKQVLAKSPDKKDMTLRLNPFDLEQLQKVKADATPGVDFVADENIEKGQCLLESSKGIIETVIEDHLERIYQALVKE